MEPGGSYPAMAHHRKTPSKINGPLNPTERTGRRSGRFLDTAAPVARAVAYVRVSTEQQASEGVSLAAQRRRIERYCEAHDLALVEVFADEGVSGSRASNRPGLESALKRVCAERGVLIVYSLSRLARSTRDTLDIASRLERAGADLCSLSERIDTTSASGKMIFRLLAVLAEFERDQCSERTRLALRFKRDRGERYCHDAPYGYKWRSGRLVPNSREQVILTRARALHRKGWSYRRIARRFALEGVTNRAGRPFPYQRIGAILKAAQEQCASGHEAHQRRTA